MKGWKHTIEQIISKLREAEVAPGSTRPFSIVPALGTSEASDLLNAEPPDPKLLHRHGLGEVSRLVDVAAAQDGGVIGQ
jgi:hypothetical protein